MNGPPIYAIHITALTQAKVSVHIPGKNFFNEFTVPANTVYKYTFPFSDLEPRGSGVKSQNAIFIESDEEISVVAVHNRNYFSSTTLLLPNKLTGLEHIVLAAQDSSLLHSPSSFLVIPQFDNTEVQITLNQSTGGGKLSVTLNRGETYQFQSSDNLSGTMVKSDKAIHLFGGAKQASILCRDDDSHVYFSVPPIAFADTLYYTRPNKYLHNASYIEVCAVEDNTVFQIKDASFKLDRKGDFIIQKLSGSTPIRSNKPILVAQMNRGTSGNSIGAGPSMTILQPANTGVKKALFRTKDNMFGKLKHSMSIFTRDTTGFMLDGNPLYGFTKFDDERVFWLQVDIEAGTHLIESNSAFWGNVYGYSFADYYTYTLGLNNFPRSFQGYGNACGNLNVYPNPTYGLISLKVDGQQIDQHLIEMYDAKGSIVPLQLGNGANPTADISYLAPGMYFIQNPCGETTKIVLLSNSQ